MANSLEVEMGRAVYASLMFLMSDGHGIEKLVGIVDALVMQHQFEVAHVLYAIAREVARAAGKELPQREIVPWPHNNPDAVTVVCPGGVIRTDQRHTSMNPSGSW